MNNDRRRLTRSQNDLPKDDATKKHHKDLRRRILEIQNDPNLTQSEKARKTQVGLVVVVVVALLDRKREKADDTVFVGDRL